MRFICGKFRRRVYWKVAVEKTAAVLDYMDSVAVAADYSFVDLGLPSGTLWATENTDGTLQLHDYRDARGRYLGLLPSREQFQELIDLCKWDWDRERKEFVITGPSGASISLPAAGSFYNRHRRAYGKEGYYWTSTMSEGRKGHAWYLFMFSFPHMRWENLENKGMLMTDEYFFYLNEFSVRFVYPKLKEKNGKSDI